MNVRVCPVNRPDSNRAWRSEPVRFFQILTFLGVLGVAASTAAQDIVLYSSDVSNIQGNWSRASSSSGAGGQKMTSADYGWSTTDSAQANPGNYFEASINVQAWTPYRVWVRMRATSDSKWNDSAYVQFSNSLNADGNAAYRIGSGSGYAFNQETCSGCGVSGW